MAVDASVRKRVRASTLERGIVVGASILLMLTASTAWAEASKEQQAPDRHTQSEPFIGVVEVPAVGGVSESDARVERRPVALRSKPTSKAPVARMLAGGTVLEYVEHRYEEMAALVYERRDGWYRVGYLDGERGSAWLSPEDAGRFTTLYDLLQDRMHHMTETWDRRLYRRPGVGDDYQVVEEEKGHARRSGWTGHHMDAELVKLSKVGKDRWAMVVILREGERCTTAHGLEAVVAAGWVPVFGATGKPNIWFYARGC